MKKIILLLLLVLCFSSCEKETPDIDLDELKRKLSDQPRVEPDRLKDYIIEQH